MQWSDVKQQVFRFESNLVVSAGAGSGKTAALVELYLRILAGETSLGRPLGVDDIVAITFTDKAAVEMKERVRRGMAARLSQGDSAADWHAHLRTLPHANISTFHSLCSRMLRENPAEAGVDPAFAMLDELAARGELQEALEEVVQKELAARSDQMRLVLKHFPLSGTGRGKGVREYLADLVTVRSGSCVTDEELVALMTGWNLRAERQLEERYRELADLVGEMERILCGKKLKFHDDLCELSRLAKLSPASPAEDDFLLRLDAMEECIRGNWGNEKPVKDRIADCLGSLQEAAWQVRSGPVAATLLGLAGKLSAAYRLRKEQRGALDFEDLQLRTRDLLRHDAGLRADYRSRFAVVMVDEFQDTNPLQKELVELLCGEEQRLFIVGDPKQSIYMFRGADVAVFSRAQAEMNDGGGQNLYFQESFRSRQGIIDFANALFGRIVMAESTTAFETGYRDGDHLLPQRLDWDGEPCVELLSVGREGDSAGKRAREAAAVARSIVEMVAGSRGVTVFDKEAGNVGRTPCFGDIVILFRRFSNLKLFESELRKADVPYYVVKGKGFYRCQEVLDMLHFLSWLEAERDLISLAGVLRSPLCGVSDETLFILSRAGGIGSWQEALSSEPVMARMATEDRSRLQSLAVLAQRLRPLRDRLTLAELLEEIITGTDFASTLLTTFQGEQKVANLRKLIELSRSFADRSDGTLHRFVAHLKELVETEPTEAEAVISAEGENVVRLMTVHQSKGLEFPVVFIPELGACQPPTTAAMIYDDSMGLGLRLSLPGGENHSSLSFRNIADLRKAKETAEAKRLFYVAVTRARDYLLLSGEGSGDWRRWIDTLIAEDGDGLIRITDASERVVNLPAASTGGPAIPVSPEEIAVAAARALLYRPPPPTSMVFSPTALEDYLQCPRKYFYKAVMGLDEGLFNELLSGEFRGSPGENAMSALEKGNLAHAMLEQVDFSAAAPAQRAVCSAMAARLAPHQRKDDTDEVTERVMALVRSPLGQELGTMRLLRELPFTLRLKGAADYRITGAMDLVAESDRAVTVYDYKYVERERAGLEGYRFQLSIYMLALARAFPGKNIHGKLIFLKGNGEETVQCDTDACERLLVDTMDTVRGKTAEGEFALLSDCDGRHCPFRERCREPSAAGF